LQESTPLVTDPAGILAVLGYVLGTYAGLLCMAILKAIAGA
jgi:hypothetical protein